MGDLGPRGGKHIGYVNSPLLFQCCGQCLVLGRPFQPRVGLKAKCWQRLLFGDADVAERKGAYRVHSETGGKVGEPEEEV